LADRQNKNRDGDDWGLVPGVLIGAKLMTDFSGKLWLNENTDRIMNSRGR